MFNLKETIDMLMETWVKQQLHPEIPAVVDMPHTRPAARVIRHVEDLIGTEIVFKWSVKPNQPQIETAFGCVLDVQLQRTTGLWLRVQANKWATPVIVHHSQFLRFLNPGCILATESELAAI